MGAPKAEGYSGDGSEESSLAQARGADSPRLFCLFHTPAPVGRGEGQRPSRFGGYAFLSAGSPSGPCSGHGLPIWSQPRSLRPRLCHPCSLPWQRPTSDLGKRALTQNTHMGGQTQAWQPQRRHPPPRLPAMQPKYPRWHKPCQRAWRPSHAPSRWRRPAKRSPQEPTPSPRLKVRGPWRFAHSEATPSRTR